jgi:hypothetical protein
VERLTALLGVNPFLARLRLVYVGEPAQARPVSFNAN